jgi:membrane-associated phospholipid phosphatase
MIHAFDWSILSFLNQFVGRWPHVDNAAMFFSENDLVRGGIPSALLWAAWFIGDGEKRDRARKAIICTLVACVLGIVIARVATLAVPFRIRPIADPSSGLHFPAARTSWVAWSAFPSDHAILFVALAICLWTISRVLGAVAFGHTAIVLGLRVYLGIHYPTDVLGGAVLGVAIAYGARWPAWQQVATLPMGWLRAHPPSFYAMLFLVTYELTVVFSDVIVFARILLQSLV